MLLSLVSLYLIAVFYKQLHRHSHTTTVLMNVVFLPQYPLLIESLLGYTDSATHPEEYEQLSRALERSKEILAYVNTAVQEAENSQRLHELQRKLDQSSLAKNKHGQLEELKGVCSVFHYSYSQATHCLFILMDLPCKEQHRPLSIFFQC